MRNVVITFSSVISLRYRIRNHDQYANETKAKTIIAIKKNQWEFN